MKSQKLSSAPAVTGQCLCGAVQFEMEYPAFWAWHDHSRASRLAHGAVYATYVGIWRKRFRITAGEREINRFEEKETGAVRNFCRRCGTPLILRAHPLAPHDQHSALSLSEPHRPSADLPHRHRRDAGLGLRRRTAGSAERLSRSVLQAIQEEKPRAGGATLSID